ncbi:unnamed protein product [Pocillopora meandrina]|uniref:Uncharacterized protein n=1 Tax=Pocillopora meandrina TaxID=46732 RepID=A0AAU9XQP8_9CNID|nr:unnamed protein product [Pocillopora meandrina]
MLLGETEMGQEKAAVGLLENPNLQNQAEKETKEKLPEELSDDQGKEEFRRTEEYGAIVMEQTESEIESP